MRGLEGECRIRPFWRRDQRPISFQPRFPGNIAAFERQVWKERCLFTQTRVNMTRHIVTSELMNIYRGVFTAANGPQLSKPDEANSVPVEDTSFLWLQCGVFKFFGSCHSLSYPGSNKKQQHRIVLWMRPCCWRRRPLIKSWAATLSTYLQWLPLPRRDWIPFTKNSFPAINQKLAVKNTNVQILTIVSSTMLI